MAEEPKKRGLGRGLNALIPENASSTNKTIMTLPIEKLKPGKYQPRRHFDQNSIDDLVESIRQKGILQPILVRKLSEEEDLYEIIAGERRWRAAQTVMLHDVPVIIRDFNDSETLEIALIENLQRENLSPLEEAEGYKRLQDEFSHTQEQLAEVVGKSRSHIANILRLLSLPPKVKQLLDSGKISPGHARAILTSENPEEIAQEIVNKNLNVRQTERLTKTKKIKPPSLKNNNKDSDLLGLEQGISEKIGLIITINDNNVIVKYDTLEQLDMIIQKLNG
jgi:ParB family chromosome partitioning protein